MKTAGSSSRLWRLSRISLLRTRFGAPMAPYLSQMTALRLALLKDLAAEIEKAQGMIKLDRSR